MFELTGMSCVPMFSKKVNIWSFWSLQKQCLVLKSELFSSKATVQSCRCLGIVHFLPVCSIVKYTPFMAA